MTELTTLSLERARRRGPERLIAATIASVYRRSGALRAGYWASIRSRLPDAEGVGPATARRA